MKQKLTKAEKKEMKAQKKADRKAKAGTPKALESKQLAVKVVSAVLCTAILGATVSSASQKYADAIKASYNGAAQNQTQSQEQTDDFLYTDTNSADDFASFSEDVGSDTDVAVSDAAQDDGAVRSEAQNTSDSGKNDSAQQKTADSNNPLNYSAAQIVNYYNSCLKKTYSLPNLTIEKTEDIKIVIDDVTPGGEKVANFGNKIVDKYAKATDFKDTFKNGKSTTGGDDAEEFSMHASLVPAGAKNAVIKKSGSGYEIRILVNSEKATLDKKPTFNSQCSNPLDLGAVDLFGLKVTQADFNYPGTMLVAVVDSEGRATSAECTMPMNGTGSGKFIISGSATVHGSMVKSAKFSF